MSPEPLDLVPEAFRPNAAGALERVLGGDGSVDGIERMTGGASGALAYRVEADGRSLVLRVETARDVFRDPARTYPCLVAAAEAGIAPAVHLADVDEGVVVMDLVASVPLTDHRDVAVEVARLLRRLQALDPFPAMLSDFGALLDQMLGFLAGAGLYKAGALSPNVDGLAAIREAYPWDRWPQVSAHNDVNPYNVLFDGTRLWLVDWELAFRNDPFADLAGLANGLALPESGISPMLEAATGTPPDAVANARFDVFRQLNRLFYGCLLASGMIGAASDLDTDGLAPDELRVAVESGALTVGSPELMIAFANTQFRAFADRMATDAFAASLRIVRG